MKWKSMMEDKTAPHPHEDEDRDDGCLSDVEFNESDALSDTDLPSSAGGVQAAIEEHDDEDGIDGCDVEFNSNEVTTDEELPVAAGGITSVEA
jgi:hypothetical protein